MNWKLYELKEIVDERGKMIVLQNNQQIPFEMKRMFYIYDVVSNALRGEHANKNSEFLIICLSGSVDVWVTDGKKEETFTLSTNNKALYLDKMVWKNMFNFSKGTVLMCITNTEYDASEYIREFNKYISLMKNAEFKQ